MIFILKNKILILFFLVFVSQNCSVVFYRPNKISAIEFKYDSLSRAHSGPHNEKPFPLTVKNGINSYASTTIDGNNLFFASNAKGNYDIYYRNLGSSSTIAITNHPSNDTKPAISPDGKKLAYVTEEYDSDGDIVVVKLDLEKQKDNYSRGKPPLSNKDFIVVTNPEYENENRIIRAIDTDPIWSHDGRFIAFTTSRFDRGRTNIALIDTASNYSIRQITYDGGTSPAFSFDDSKIFYLSYKDSSLGELYEVDLLSLKERRITTDIYKDLSPTVSNDGRYLIYSSIRKDTNGNGKLEGRDNAIIIRYDLFSGKSVELTAGNYSLFDTRYSNLNGGSILFTAALDNALNIYFIPVDGVIPKQDNIKSQFEFTKYYNDISLDFNKVAIDAIEQFFGSDNLFYLYRSKSDIELVKNYFQSGRISEGENLIKLMLDSKSDPNEGLSYALAWE